MYVRFHHVDRVKRQFGSEQPIPLDPVNLDGFIRASARGEDKWWPAELDYWAREHQIQIVHTHYPDWPTKEYADWWVVACHRQFLSPDRLLQDPRGAQLPDDVPPAATQARDPIVLPCDAPARRRRAQMQHPDIRRKGEGASTSGRSDAQPGGKDVDEEAEYRRQEDIPDGVEVQDQGGDDPTPHEADIDFFSGADIELVQFILHGEGSGSGSAPHASAGGSFGHHLYGPPQEMYEILTCGEQTVDHIAHEYLASRTSDDAVYRPGHPLQPHPDPAQQCPIILPVLAAAVLSVTFSGSATLPAPGQLSHTIAPSTVLSECVTAFTPHPQHDDPSYHSAPEPSPHQIVHPRAQRPQKDRHPAPCGTSSHLHHRPVHGGDRA
ncbi:hypothetical protein PIB30_035432 [Stylosanthes scabra]|uniref:Aminotransferase-like plant mobile domain-containing protein n=1 Tax=Stylosanthes scabra TaxID=79078 RepID=A0ABU6SEE0_9FABA|nr:hypothetical protein [Stylosanthes scabra]